MSNYLTLNTFCPGKRLAPPPIFPQESIEQSIMFPELHENIFKHLTPSDLANTHLVSKKWSEYSDNGLISWFNSNPKEPINPNLSDEQLLNILKVHGKYLTCLNLKERTLDNDKLKTLIEYCPNLKQLYIYDNDDDIYYIDDEGLEHLESLKELELLDLSECNHITDNGLAHTLPDLIKLKYLCLNECKNIRGNFLEDIKDLKLEHLDLGACDISDENLAHLSNFTALIFLNLGYSLITDEGLEHFESLKALQQVDLDNSNVTAGGVLNSGLSSKIVTSPDNHIFKENWIEKELNSAK